MIYQGVFTKVSPVSGNTNFHQTFVEPASSWNCISG